MAGRNRQLKVETQREHSFITQEDYQDIFWNLFHISQTAIAFSDRAGKLMFCNNEFRTRIMSLLGAGAGFSEYVRTEVPFTRLNDDVVEIEIHTQPSVKLCRMDLHNHPGGATHLWFTNGSIGGSHNRQITVIKNLYDSFIDNSFEVVFCTSEADNILFFNKNFVRTFEFSELVLTRDFKIMDLVLEPEDFHRFKQRVVEEKQVLGETMYFKTLFGKTVVGLVNCHLQQNSNGTSVMNWTVLDISERVRYEESLRQKEEQLSKVSAQMEKFLYSTSHDLRSPLTSIFGLVNLLRMELSDKNILEYVSRIESSTLKLDKIIRDIMSFSKTTYQHVDCEPIDFQKLLDKVINTYSDDPNFRLIQFELHFNMPVQFYSDHERLEIIIDALVRNCVHFVDTNKIRPFVRINVSVDDNHGLIEIMDNGIGIMHQHLDQIFNMFYKASLQSRGAGLGLYIVKEGIEQLSGTISVESEPGFGSIFRLKLPNDKK